MVSVYCGTGVLITPTQNFSKSFKLRVDAYLGRAAQSAITYSKLTTETLEQGVKYLQS